MADTPSSAAVVGRGRRDHTFDAIVVGSGMSGGWAAKELCEGGLNTLVLERGRNVEHIKDYDTAMKEVWELPHRNQLTPQFREDNPILTKCYAVDQATQQFFVKDAEHPYVQEKPFDWIRGYQVGGKSLLWARWTQRWSDHDFEANLRDGHGVDWPIRYRDIAPWYSHVERFVGISGSRDGIAHVPDGEFLPPMELNCLESHFKSSIESRYPDRHLIVSRTANLSQPHLGRGPCQYRDRCARGCPFSGYFSANSATLPAAAATGRMTLRPDSVVHSLLYDDASGRATGVRVIDAKTREVTEYFSKIVFVNAGTLNTALLLLNSKSDRFPHGLGNDSDQLGRNLMDHNYRVKITGAYDGLRDRYYYGKKPTGGLIPPFRNIGSDRQSSFLRSYAFTVFGSRGRGYPGSDEPPIGATLKQRMSELGSWGMWVNCMAEHLPDPENRVTLSPDETDAWGMPLIHVRCEHKGNELRMIEDMLQTGPEMLEAAGFRDITAWDAKENPGMGIHEMGTARMGRDPESSVLNAFNQIHSAPNVFVTDGAAMASSSWQNPSLTYMALTARAANHALQELKEGKL